MHRRTTHILRRVAAMALTAVLATTGAVVTAAAPAQAAISCSDPANKPNGEGYALVKEPDLLYLGPYSACGAIRTMALNDVLYIWCHWVNDYGNTWFYGRVAGTSTYGWMYTGAIEWIKSDDDGDGTVEARGCTR